MAERRKSRDLAATLIRADVAAREAVKPYRRTAAVAALAQVSELGDQPQMLGISGAVLALGLFRSDPRMVRAGARMIAAHLLATGLKTVVKHRVDRTRPRNAASGGGPRPKPGQSKAKEKSSFPSGHSAGAIAVARAFAREYPEHRLPALGAATLIALAQIPRRAHYPTDVAAGLAIGLAAEGAVAATWHLAERQGNQS